MESRYIVLSPTLMGKFHQDELITLSQLGDAVTQFLAKGAIRELRQSDAIRFEELTLKVFTLPTDALTFSTWLSSIIGTPRICHTAFKPDVGRHEFPIGDGYITVGRAESIPASHPDGYLRIGIHAMYFGVTKMSTKELQSHEPISFRILTLSRNRIRIQARNGVIALAAYFEAILAEIQVRWPEADLGLEGDEVKPSLAVDANLLDPLARPLKVMICYSHHNESQRKRIDTHLALLRRQGLIDIWCDRKITAGSKWESEIDKHLNGSDLILLLVSAEFLESDYCYGIEMERALERHRASEARVIPIVLRDCFWLDTKLSELQALPTDGFPVDSKKWKSTNAAYVNIAKGIQKAVEEIRKGLSKG